LTFITGGVGFIGYILYTLKGYISDEDEAWAVYESVRDRLEQDLSIRYTLGDPVKGAPQDSSNSRIRNTLGYNFEHTEAGDRLFLTFYMIGSRSKGAVSVERFRVMDLDCGLATGLTLLDRKQPKGDNEAHDVLIFMDNLYTGQRMILADNRQGISSKSKRKGLFGIDWLRRRA
jgi:hypothetical protein